MTDPTDPIEEPPNSTVDDWMGQVEARDEALADRLVAESGGDLDEAERRFDEQSAHGEDRNQVRGRPGHVPPD